MNFKILLKALAGLTITSGLIPTGINLVNHSSVTHSSNKQLTSKQEIKEVPAQLDYYWGDVEINKERHYGWIAYRLLNQDPNTVTTAIIPETYTDPDNQHPNMPVIGTYTHRSYIGLFANCINLKAVVLPNSFLQITPFTFAYCKNLNNLTLGNSLMEIQAFAFVYCSSLTTISFPSSINFISGAAFHYCSGINSIFVDDDNTKYGLKKFAHGAYLYSKEDSEYAAVSSLAYGDIDLTGATTIKNSAFQRTNITSVKIPEGINRIGDSAFEGCSFLNGVVIPSSVTEIGVDAFFGCLELDKINIPSGINTIGNRAFFGAPLKAIDFDGNEHYLWFHRKDEFSGWIINKDQQDKFSCPTGLAIGTIDLANCPDTIAENAFRFCSGISNLLIAEGVTTISSNAFYNCSQLTSLSLPSTLSSIQGRVFEECNSIKKISLNKLNKTFGLKEFANGGYIYQINGNQFANVGCLAYGEIDLTGAVVINKQAFWKCSSLTGVLIPNTVNIINQDAFDECKNIQKLDLPYETTNIGSQAFGNCNNLKDIYFHYDDEQLNKIIDLMQNVKGWKGVFANTNELNYSLIDKLNTSIHLSDKIYDQLLAKYQSTFNSYDWKTGTGVGLDSKTTKWLRETTQNKSYLALIIISSLIGVGFVSALIVYLIILYQRKQGERSFINKFKKGW